MCNALALELLIRAAWLAYMKDGGYPIQDGGALSIPAYLAYRTNIESRQSLAYELCSLRLGLLPKELQHWGLLKQHFRQLDHWRQERRAHSKEEMARLTGRKGALGRAFSSLLHLTIFFRTFISALVLWWLGTCLS